MGKGLGCKSQFCNSDEVCGTVEKRSKFWYHCTWKFSCHYTWEGSLLISCSVSLIQRENELKPPFCNKNNERGTPLVAISQGVVLPMYADYCSMSFDLFLMQLAVGLSKKAPSLQSKSWASEFLMEHLLLCLLTRMTLITNKSIQIRTSWISHLSSWLPLANTHLAMVKYLYIFHFTIIFFTEAVDSFLN